MAAALAANSSERVFTLDRSMRDLSRKMIRWV
jgi:hypothetical protein